MRRSDQRRCASRQVGAFLLLLLLVGLIYSNSLDSDWALDDGPNILENPKLRISDLLPETLYPALMSPDSDDRGGVGDIYRPIAMLSFALNWYIGQYDPTGYHVVNTMIHALTAFVIFLTIRALMESPNLKRSGGEGKGDFIALLAAVLWAVNPIQTQAVVYIVQRMAALAALFYLLSVYCYVKARLCDGNRTRYTFLFACVLSFICSLLCKENTVTLPVALVLLEFVFFQNWQRPRTRWVFGVGLAASLVTVLAAGSIIFLRGDLSSLLHYEARLFTPVERLLTQPRILIFYLSQIFYPAPTRLSIDHDIELSTSLLEPWATLPAIILLFGIVLLGFAQIRRRPALSFAILFFFLNHVVESSIIGLELIFEHRNYLPSAFLFLPVAMGLSFLLEAYRSRSPAMHGAIALFIALVVVGLGMGTYIRNQAWADARTLWEDAAQKSPASMRSLQNLAFEYYEKQGFHDKALELYRQALGLRCYNKASLALVHNNIASSLFRSGNFHAARAHLEQAIAILPEYENLHYWLATVLMNAGDFDRAQAVLAPLVSKRPDHFDYIYLKAYIHLKKRELDDALAYLRRCIMRRPDSLKTYVMIGATLSLKGDYDRAKWFFFHVRKRTPTDEATLLYLIDANLKAGDEANARYFAEQYLSVAPLGKLPEAMAAALREGFLEDSARERLLSFVSQRAMEHIRTALTPAIGMAMAPAGDRQ